MSRAIADHSRTIRIPVHMIDKGKRVLKISQQLGMELGRQPTLAEVVERSKMPEELVHELLHNMNDPLSIDKPYGSEEGSTLQNVVPDQNVEDPLQTMMKTDLSEVIEGMLAELPPRRRKLSKCVLELVTSVSTHSMRLARNLESLGSGSDSYFFKRLLNYDILVEAIF